MKVKYKDGSIYGPGLTDFPYQEGEDIYYHGHIT